MDKEKVISGLETIRFNLRQMGHRLLADFCDDVLTLLKEQTAVVRCKDCKYYDNFNGCMSWHDVNSNNDNWYCADGERQELI